MFAREHAPQHGNLSEHRDKGKCRQHIEHGSHVRVFLVQSEVDQYYQGDTKIAKAIRLTGRDFTPT
jgi:hypothetical protein